MEHTDIAIVGGGIWGASIAFHLAKLGKQDIVLLDRGPLASETSSQGAGFLCSVRHTEALTRLCAESTRFYARFEEETGHPLDLHLVGGVRIALTARQYEKLRAEQAVARRLGVVVEELTHRELEHLLPSMAVDKVYGAHIVPLEGYVRFTRQAALGMAKGAQRAGVRVRSHTPIDALRRADDGGFLLELPDGPLHAETIVLAAGAGTGRLARSMEVTIPAYPIQHQCMVVAPRERVPDTMPTVRIPEHDLYIRHEDGGMLLGGVVKSVGPAPDAPASALRLAEVEPDREVLKLIQRRSQEFFPLVGDAFVMWEQRGLPMVSPDLDFVLGETPSVPRLFVASGCTLRGVQSAPGVGALLAQMIVYGETEIDASCWRLDRFGDRYRDPESLYQACRTALGPQAPSETPA